MLTEFLILLNIIVTVISVIKIYVQMNERITKLEVKLDFILNDFKVK